MLGGLQGDRPCHCVGGTGRTSQERGFVGIYGFAFSLGSGGTGRYSDMQA